VHSFKSGLLDKLVGHRQFYLHQPTSRSIHISNICLNTKNYLRNLLFLVRVHELLQTEIAEVDANLVTVSYKSNDLTENGLAFLFCPRRVISKNRGISLCFCLFDYLEIADGLSVL
jgi:hypothetical protein